MNSDYSTPAAVRTHNLSYVLHLIRTQGRITRAELIKDSHLSATTISALVNVLMDSGFIYEAGIGTSSGGRRPVKLEFNYNARYMLGIDMGNTHVTAVLMNLAGQVVETQTHAHDVLNQVNDTIQLIRESIYHLIEHNKIEISDLLGIGWTVPAPLINDVTGEFISYYMPTWQGVRPVSLLQPYFPEISIFMENDANAAAVAEKWWGSGVGVDNLVYIKLGTGIGAGLIIDGEIYRGFAGTAGEIGHMTVEPKGRLCRCGNSGCMESYVGLPGIMLDVRSGLLKEGALPENFEKFNFSSVIHEAQKGNAVCRDVIVNAGRYLGIGITNLMKMFDPGLIILGGELIAADRLLLQAVNDSVKERIAPLDLEPERIIIGNLGPDAVSVGAATIVLQRALDPSRLYQTLYHSQVDI
jgi:predicted NBD/HSP70 family sugar kinase